jgi:hypothetical protein
MTFVQTWRRTLVKGLAACALALGLSVAAIDTARGETWNFSYTGSGVSAAGTFTGAWNGSFFDIVSISGVRNGVAITGLFGTNNYYVATLGAFLPSLKVQFNTTTGSFTLGWVDWAANPNLGSFIGYPGGGAVGTEASHPTFPSVDTRDDTVGTLAFGLCDNGLAGCTPVSLTITPYSEPAPEPVPEIDATSGLGSLAVLLAIVLLFREMFLRRRATTPSPL